jgi:rubrerythrin
MKEERAIEILKVRNEFVSDMNIDTKTAYKLAIESLKKQIPKKIDDMDCCTICGTCGKDDNDVEGEYCPNCGQKLDWN